MAEAEANICVVTLFTKIHSGFGSSDDDEDDDSSQFKWYMRCMIWLCNKAWISHNINCENVINNVYGNSFLKDVVVEE